MLIKDIKKYIKFLTAALPCIGLVTLASCRSDEDFYRGSEFYADSSIDFTGKIDNSLKRSTRALTNPPEYVSNAIFGKNNFYVEINMDTTINGETQTLAKTGTYFIPTGMAGLLEHKDTSKDNPKPNWYNPLDPHYFWSWTVPWMDDYSSTGGEEETPGGEITDPDDLGSRAEGDGDTGEPTTPPADDNTNNPLASSIRYTIKSTAAEDINSEKFPNGAILENFIGTKTGPLNYKNNGKDVELQYKHLVSKIRVEKFVLIDAYGNAQTQVAGTLSFINMPNSFVFYPHPDGTNGTTEDGAPIAVTDFSTADINSVTLSFGLYQPDPDEEEPPVELYVCPEIDFSKVQYKVDITYPEKYAARGSYWGDFSNLNFERIPDTDYDQPGEEPTEPSDPNDPNAPVYPADKTILHAGEMMLFTLQVKEIGGSGISCTLSPWATGETNPANHHSHPGIYSDTEAKQLVDAGTNATLWETLYEQFGDGTMGDTEDIPAHLRNKKIFKLYRDGLINGMSFPVGDGYVLDGMGYMITFTPTSSNSSKVTLGRMRDIHIQVPGEPTLMIYVDVNGDVWWEDPKTGEMLPTNHSLTETSQTLDLANLSMKE